MNKFSLVTQIGLIAVAVAIVVLYIEPKITSIRQTQDLTSSYELETQNVSQVNESLKAKIAAIETIAPQDALALARYVPDTVDEIAVLKDISTVLEMQSINDFDLKYQGNNVGTEVEGEVASEFGAVTEHYFSVSFEAGYDQLKSVLAQLETNNYLLQVSNLKITDTKEGVLKADVSITTFSRLLVMEEINQ
jgi:uncharacterized protein YqgV (UPF0045/DUF77 family)